VGVLLGDALAFCEAVGDSHFSPTVTPAAIVIDINAGRADLKSGLSFPPAQFLQPALLESMASALGRREAGAGLLLVNLGARNPDVLKSSLRAVAQAFPPHSVYLVSQDEEEEEGGGEETGINCVLLACGAANGGGWSGWTPPVGWKVAPVTT